MQRLRELRKQRGLSMRELGRELGLSESAVSLYESGRRRPNHDLLCRLADYFGVSVDYLLCRTEERLTAKEYKEKDSYELAEFMSGHTITVGGVVVSPADKRRICDMATGLFWTRITGEEKK